MCKMERVNRVQSDWKETRRWEVGKKRESKTGTGKEQKEEICKEH